jgi:membrane-bound serine protease (ClpP class)
MLAFPLPPLVAMLLLAASLLLVVLEFNRPGLIVPGALGLLGILLTLASMAHDRLAAFHIATFCLAAALTAAAFRRPNITLGTVAAILLMLVFRQLSGPHPPLGLHLLGLALGFGIAVLYWMLALIAQRARINKGHPR